MKNSIKLKSALVAVGGSLAAAPAAAIELGDVKVHSTIGQPLRASVAYALGPNEQISDTCVSLVGGPSASGMPAAGRASMIVTDGVIAITGSSVVREPLVSMRVNIRCPYTPQITREYMLFIDPADAVPLTASAPLAATSESPVVARRASAPTQPSNAAPVTAAARYRVRPGDSLSQIAQRIENRRVGLWSAAEAIFAANPGSFVGNDINRLRAGSWLDIPDFGAGEPVTITDADTAPVSPAAPVAAGTVYDAAPVDDAAAIGDSAYEPPAIEPTRSPLADLQPGDVVDESLVLPDMVVDTPAATSSQPNVPVAIVAPRRSDTNSRNWLIWLFGGGLSVIAGLLLFARFRDRFGSAPVGASAETPRRRHTDGDTQRIEAIGDVEIEIDDDSPTAENLTLDADLVLGTGLQEGSQVDVTQDFAFAATTELDLELPEEVSSGAADEKAHTDIIPPLNIDESSILDSEVMPDIDDDYDMSMIVDATKMPDPDDVTERDLEAVALIDDDEAPVDGDYTVSQEVDYKILEQDYEDELTATQALNAEIQRAADELALRIDDEAEDDTQEISMATVHELDVTAQLRGQNDDQVGDDDDTGVNPTVELDADDKTVEMPKGGTRAG